MIDPTWGRVSPRSAYKKNYNITIPPKKVATPKEAKKPSEVEAALREFMAINELGSIVKKAVVELVAMKTERVLTDRKNVKEKAEFDAKLKKMFTFD